MATAAVVENGVVVTMNNFDRSEDIATWDFGEGRIGIEVTEGMVVAIGYIYSDGVFSPPPTPEPTYDELVEMAEIERYQRIQYVYGAMQGINYTMLQARLLIGEGRDGDSEVVSGLLECVSQLKMIDTSLAPNINWPIQPDVPSY